MEYLKDGGVCKLSTASSELGGCKGLLVLCFRKLYCVCIVVCFVGYLFSKRDTDLE